MKPDCKHCGHPRRWHRDRDQACPLGTSAEIMKHWGHLRYSDSKAYALAYTGAMADDEGNRIAAIFYQDGRPHSVFTRAPHAKGGVYGDEFDFNWCPMDDVFVYHSSGSGGGWPYLHPYERRSKGPPPAALWLAHGCLVAPCNPQTGHKERPTRSARKLRRLGYKLLRHPILVDGKPNPFNAWSARYGPDRVTEYCQVCGCHRTTDYGNPCEHLAWCDDCGGWDGIGADEPCGHTLPQTCEPNCGHTVLEHVAFERGLWDGEHGNDENPYWDSATGGQGQPELVLAWDTGHSVGHMNRQAELDDKAKARKLDEEDPPAHIMVDSTGGPPLKLCRVCGILESEIENPVCVPPRGVLTHKSHNGVEIFNLWESMGIKTES